MSVYHENALEPGSAIADYTIESMLGHGAFGITYLAQDPALGSYVAIKEYLPQEIATRDTRGATVIPHASHDAIRQYHWGLKNFVNEARALARFKHPNIVRVLRFIEANGTAYVVMEYEEGKTLFQQLQGSAQRLDERTLLRIMIPILNGLQAVHDAGLLHLDIKPENIYLRRDGSPMLIDFGSARQAMTETASGRVTLTHGYAPVEQYPDKGQLGPWSDVYAVGATMYRCVTGKRPDEALARYRAVLDYKVDPLKPAVRAGEGRCQPMLLECIDWAMQIHAKDRPQSARQLQDGLVGRGRPSTNGTAASPVRYGGAPTAAAGAPARAMPKRQDRAQPRRVIPLVLGVAFGLGVWYAWPEIKQMWRRHIVPVMGSQPMSEAPKQRRPAQASSPGNTREKAAAIVPPIVTVPPSALQHVLAGHTDWVHAVAFAPDARRLATASNDRAIRVWDVRSGKTVNVLKQQYLVNALAYSPNGKVLAAVDVDGKVRLLDVDTMRSAGTLDTSTYALYAVTYAADGRTLAAAGRDRMVYVWDAATGKRRHLLEGHTGEVNALAFAPNGKTLASAGADRQIRLWNTETGELIGELPGHKDIVLALAISPDGRRLVSGDAGHSVRLWDPETLAPIQALSFADQPIVALAFGPSRAWFVVGAADKTVYIVDAESGGLIKSLTGHQDAVQAVAISADGRQLATAGRDKTVRLWTSR